MRCIPHTFVFGCRIVILSCGRRLRPAAIVYRNSSSLCLRQHCVRLVSWEEAALPYRTTVPERRARLTDLYDFLLDVIVRTLARSHGFGWGVVVTRANGGRTKRNSFKSKKGCFNRPYAVAKLGRILTIRARRQVNSSVGGIFNEATRRACSINAPHRDFTLVGPWPTTRWGG